MSHPHPLSLIPAGQDRRRPDPTAAGGYIRVYYLDPQGRNCVMEIRLGWQQLAQSPRGRERLQEMFTEIDCEVLELCLVEEVATSLMPQLDAELQALHRQQKAQKAERAQALGRAERRSRLSLVVTPVRLSDHVDIDLERLI